jgi:CMP-N,N'-diacetyllegionaminic acid synthase
VQQEVDLKIIAIIPARGGSKGVKNKNIRMVHGKPLIAWTIEEALKSKWINDVLVSTDDIKIAEISKRFGAKVPFLRDSSLAQDETPTIDVVIDVLNRYLDFDWGILLQPTSPLRTANDIDEMIEECFTKKALSSVSVCQTEESPFWVYKKDDNNHLVPLFDGIRITRRQDLPLTYRLNGAMYFFNRNDLLKTRQLVNHQTLAYEMPISRSIDLDTENDFKNLNALNMEILKDEALS